MGRKFMGLMIVVGMTAFIGMVSMPSLSHNEAEAGLFRRLFGIQSDCSGGGGGLQRYSYSSSCGGGGLQSAMVYSSCSGGGLQFAPYADCSGGGGGLQYAPASYYYSTPSYYVPASGGCPGGVCPPGSVSGGLTYSPTYYAPAYATASPPIRLNPGERYVAGSLRISTPSQSTANNAPSIAQDAKPQKSKGSTVSGDWSAPQLASDDATKRLPNGFELIQLSQDGCHPCEDDRQKARQAKVPLTVLSFSETEDAFKIANLVGQFEKITNPEPIEGTPYYLLVKDGVVYSTHAGPMQDFNSAVKVAQSFSPKPTAVASAKVEQSTPLPNDKLDRIENAMLQLVDEMKATRQTIEGLRTAAR